MARPHVADGGTTSNMGIAANILNEESPTADKGFSSSLGLGEMLKTPHRKNVFCYEFFIWGRCCKFRAHNVSVGMKMNY